MGFLEKLQIKNFFISSKTKENTLSNFDSRNYIKREDLDKTEVSVVQDMIEKFDSYTTYEKCFLNSIFLSEIAPYIVSHKEFIDCELELTNLLKCSSLFLNWEFKNCTFYIADYDSNTVSFDLNPSLKNKLYSNNNVIYKKSYIEYLAYSNNNNLNNVSQELLNGICLNYSDLSECILPDNKYFFSNLSDLFVHDLKLPNVDLNKYNLSNVRFSNIVFSNNCILSNEMMKKGLCDSVLPIIDFTKIKESDYSAFRFSSCIFNENTVFPKDLNFFMECKISNSTLPTFDYSNYNVDKNSFYKCIFTEESKLPKAFFTEEYINCIESIETIPSVYLEKVVMLSKLTKPKDFYIKYKSKLSQNSSFILHISIYLYIYIFIYLYIYSSLV